MLASGLGSLENVEPDGKDGLYVLASTQNAVLRLTRSGAPTVAVAGVSSPGGLRVRDGALFFNSGDAAQAGALGTADGTISRLDLRTGRRTTWASGLTMPNGLAFLPDGSAVTSRDVAALAPTGITRVTKAGAVQPSWSDQADSNGMAVDPTGRWLYSDETFTSASNSSGALYLAANGAGQVLRLDPRTKQSCVIASGLQNTSAVKQGRGRAFPAGRLYVTGFDGRVLELTPPLGVRP